MEWICGGRVGQMIFGHKPATIEQLLASDSEMQA